MIELSCRDRIILLAASLEDYLPGPQMPRGDWSAEGPSERRECRKCKGEGRLRAWNRIEPCTACGSKGVVEVDSYTGRVVGKLREDEFAFPLAEVRETLQAERADYDSRRRRRERVDHLLSESRGGEDMLDAMQRRKRALYRAGDYARLSVKLLELSVQEPLWAAAFMLVYGPAAEMRRPSPSFRLRADLALDWLEDAMPKEIRVPAWLLAGRSRDDEILRLASAREPQAAIAQRLGISVATVSRRLKLLTAV